MRRRSVFATVVAASSFAAAGSTAHAEGEYGPMFGGAIVGTHADEVDIAGAGAELAFWYGPIGLAFEGRHQWTVDDTEGPRLTTAGASLRVLAFAHIVPSLLDSKESVELGIELHGIVEHGWWTATNTEDARVTRDGMRYGFGAALRLRGATDDDQSNLLAESRVFVRVMHTRESGRDSRDNEAAISARGVIDESREGVMVLVGLGAAWGGGRPGYVARLRRLNTLDAETIVQPR